MRVVTPTHLRARLGEILDAASAGERILIERDRRPLAYLMSVEDGQRIDDAERKVRTERALAALDRLEELRVAIARDFPQPPDGLTEAEGIQDERERRMDQIDAAARSMAQRSKE